MNWDKLEIYALVAGSLLSIAGKALGISIAVSFGVGLIALDIALVGVEAIVTRKMKWGITWYSHETYQGSAAISLGAIMLILGIGFGAMVVAQSLNRQEVLLEIIFGRPGSLLLLIGTLTTLRGIAGVIGALEWKKSVSSRIGGMLERAASFLLAIVGLFCLAAGFLNVASPATFRNLVSAVWKLILNVIGIH